MSNLEQFVKKGLFNKGVYSPTVTYYKDNIVTYGNKVYICLKDVSIGVDPTNTSYWEVISSAAELAVNTVGSGTNPATFTLINVNGVITLNRVS